MAYHVEGKAEVLHHHPDGVALVTAEGSVPATVEKLQR